MNASTDIPAFPYLDFLTYRFMKIKMPFQLKLKGHLP
jgi:hypothetical protein